MAKAYSIEEKDLVAIEKARKENRDKNVERRLTVLTMRGSGKKLSEISEATGFHIAHISKIISKYVNEGLDAVMKPKYGGNRRNMSVEQEAEILKDFVDKASKGQMVDIKEIAAAYQAKVDHKVSDTQIYCVLHRHGWRKVMPRSKHPKSASPEVVETSKKITEKSQR